jgi:hypothetical protein
LLFWNSGDLIMAYKIVTSQCTVCGACEFERRTAQTGIDEKESRRS